MEIAGKPVRDAKRKLQLSIKQSDIDRGDNKDPGGCAAALALKRQEHVKAARVHLSQTYIDMGDHWLRFETPNRLRSEIVTFDRGGKFIAADYILNPPRKSNRLGARDDRKARAKRESPRRRAKIARRKAYNATSEVRHTLAR